MKKLYLFAAVAVALFALSAHSFYAQDGRPGGFGGPGGQGRGGPGGDMMRRFPLMMALDADGDGVISAKEIDGAPAALRKLDKNSDGQLTEDELRPNFPERGGPGGRGGERGERGGPGGPNPEEMVQRLMEFDKNGDGKLSKDEVPERMQGLFERGDTNKDGFLSKDEIRAMAQSQGGGSRDEGRPQRPPNEE